MLFLKISASYKEGTQAELYYWCFDLAFKLASKANLPNNLSLIHAEFSFRDNKKVVELSPRNNQISFCLKQNYFSEKLQESHLRPIGTGWTDTPRHVQD